MGEGKLEKFCGHWEECLNHFYQEILSRFPERKKGISQLKEPVAHFCQVDVQTMTDWFKSRYKPRGISFLRLMLYLDMSGYRVLELEPPNMAKYRRYFIELIVFEVISIEEALQITGFTTPSNLYRVLNRDHRLSSVKEQAMWDSYVAKRHVLAKKKDEIYKTYCQNGQPIVKNAEDLVKASQLPVNFSMVQVLLHQARAMRAIINDSLTEQLMLGALNQDDLLVIHELALVVGNLSSKLIIQTQGKED